MIKTIKSNCFILFYELMGIIFTPIIRQSVPRVYRLCIPMKNSSSASLQTFQHPLTPSSGGGPQFILIPYWNFLVYFTRRIWLVNCETLSKTNTETRNFSASCVDTREIMLAIISVFLPSPATAACWILDSADPILGGVEMNKSAEHTTPKPWLGHRSQVGMVKR